MKQLCHGRVVRVVLVLAEFTDANFGYYDERFSHRIASGDLDYTKFAAGSDDNAIYLENSGVNITLSTPSRNPLVVIANYLLTRQMMHSDLRAMRGRNAYRNLREI